MSKLRFRRPSPAMIVACTALVVALGGSALAATKIKSKNIKNGAVTTKKIKTGAVTAKKVKSGTLTKAQLAKHAVTGSRLGQAAVSNGKLADNAVNGPKVEDGSLSLPKVAQIVADVSPDVPSLVPGDCADVDIAVSGAQANDSVLALRRGPNFNSLLTLSAGPQGAGTVRLTFCNPDTSGGAATLSGPEDVKLALFH
jgi:hypothetical protein